MKLVLYVSLVVATGALARGYLAADHTTAMYWILGFGLIWLIALIRRWHGFTSIGFLACVAAAGYGLWIGLPSGWMLAGAVGALIVWDLSDFYHRVKDAAPEDEIPGLERRHLIRLSIVTATGLVFSIFGMLTHLRLSFEWTAFLAILSALGLSLLVRRMRRRQ